MTLLRSIAATLAFVVLTAVPSLAQEASGSAEAPAGQAATTDTATTETAPATDPAAPVVIAPMAIGPADAKVTIVEYASFTCPHCADFHENTFKPLKEQYIDTGKVRFEMRSFLRNRYDVWATMIARCGGEMRFFGISGLMFEQQQEWAASDDPAVVVGNLKRIGRAAGMEDAAMDACLNDRPTAEALVAFFQETSLADGVEGTPTIFINGERYGNMTFTDMQAIIDPLLAE
jgi:protein-disulfide isomerase